MLFQTTFEPNLVAEASKELVFVLSQRKIRGVAISFFGVGGSGRRPLEFWRRPLGPAGERRESHFSVYEREVVASGPLQQPSGGARDSQETPEML